MTDVFHDFAVGTTGINAGLASEVGPEDAIVGAFPSEPVFVILRLLSLHTFEDLRENGVPIAVVDLAFHLELRGLESVNTTFNATVTALVRFACFVKSCILNAIHAVVS